MLSLECSWLACGRNSCSHCQSVFNMIPMLSFLYSCAKCDSFALSFSIFSKNFDTLFNQLVFSSHLCGLLSRLLQRWNWTWYIWLSLVFGHNAAYQAFLFCYLWLNSVILLILLINIQPYKKSSVRCPSTDTTFFILLALFFAAILGLDLSALESAIYGMILLIICVISAYLLCLLLANQDKEKEQSLISFIYL